MGETLNRTTAGRIKALTHFQNELKAKPEMADGFVKASTNDFFLT